MGEKGMVNNLWFKKKNIELKIVVIFQLGEDGEPGRFGTACSSFTHIDPYTFNLLLFVGRPGLPGDNGFRGRPGMPGINGARGAEGDKGLGKWKSEYFASVLNL